MAYIISVIIPFYNENANINNLINAANIFFVNKEYNAELVFVDDGSSDGSSDSISQHKFENYSVKLVKLSKNFGSHIAYRAGVANASGSFVIGLPADLQDPLTLIDECFELLKSNDFDIIFAHRRQTNNSWSDTFFSKKYALLMQKFVSSNFPENGFDIVMFNNKIKNELNKNIESNSSIFLQILGMGFIQTSIVYNKKERKIGKSKWTISKKIKMLIDSFVAFLLCSYSIGFNSWVFIFYFWYYLDSLYCFEKVNF
jgi:glycosyltransferase involved in cell wall biosynthesis